MNTTSSGKDATSTNPRGIPVAPFVDRVEDYVTSRAEVEGTLKNFQEMISYVVRRWFAPWCAVHTSYRLRRLLPLECACDQD